MDIAMLGLGRMGGNMARRLLRGGHRVALWNRDSQVSEKIKAEEKGGEVARAVGDVAALKLPNGSPHPKAGVFAEAQALTVARHLAAEIAGAEKVPYAGRGTCFVDVGRAMAAPAEIDLLAEGGPQFRIDPPSSRGLDEKRKFETDRFERWFGG